MRIGQFSALPVDLDAPLTTLHLPAWRSKDDGARMQALRQIVISSGRDPRLATLSVQILKNAGVKPRDYRGQAAALLLWVQKNIYYVNEPGERLQDPLYTLRVRYGDCDDMVILLATFYETIRLPWKFVLSGPNKSGKLIRWVEGDPKKNARWSHIYLIVGSPPFKPTKWEFAEPTLNVPLGWDIVQVKHAQGRSPLPELGQLPSQVAGQKPTQLIDRSWTEVAEYTVTRLHPKIIIPLVIVGAITTFFSTRLARKIAESLDGKKTRKKRRK